MNREALGAFNQDMTQSLAFDHKIEITKSRGKDWNQDLKESQMQQVVKREFGINPSRLPKKHGGAAQSFDTF